MMMATNFYLFTLVVAKIRSCNKHFIVTAGDEVYKHYFNVLKLKRSVVNKNINQWQPRLQPVQYHSLIIIWPERSGDEHKIRSAPT